MGYYLSKETKDYRLYILTGNSCLYIYQQPYHVGCQYNIDDKLKIDNFLSEFTNSIFIYVGDVIDIQYYEHFNQKLENELPKTFDF